MRRERERAREREREREERRASALGKRPGQAPEASMCCILVRSDHAPMCVCVQLAGRGLDVAM